MLTSISPLGERARHNRWGWTVSWYLSASTVAAGVIGLGLGALGQVAAIPATGRAVGLAVLAVVAVAIDAGPLGLPTWRRQVDEDWLNRYRGWVYGGGFGLQLGAGVLTIVTTAAVYLTLAAEVATGSALGGLVVGAVFGAVRAAPILAVGRTRTFADLTGRHRRLMTLARPVRRATVAVMSLGAIALVAAVAGGAG